MPRQRLVFSDTDPQCTNDTLHQSGRYGLDSESNPPSCRNIGLTKSYSSSEALADAHLHTNKTSGSEAAADQSHTSGLKVTEVG